MLIVEVPLNNNYTTTINARDLGLITEHHWYVSKNKKQFYVRAETSRRGGRNTLKLHRLIIGAKPGELVDHKDGNGLNNTRKNLRSCTHVENARNGRAFENSTSCFRGVSWNRARRKWEAKIHIRGFRKHLGYFGCEVEAAKAYDSAAREFFGEFARPNFGDEAKNAGSHQHSQEGLSCTG